MTGAGLPSVEAAVRGIWPLLSLCLILIVLAALCSLGPVVLQRVATDALIKLVMVVGLYVFVGNSGVLSFGHASFMMLGGFGAAWLDVPVRYKKILMDELPAFLGQAEFHPGLAALAAMGWAGAFAFLIGIPLMRLSGIAAAIGTFSWLTIVFVVHAGWEEMTGGTSSFNGLPVYVDLWVALGAALFVMLVAYVFRLRSSASRCAPRGRTRRPLARSASTCCARGSRPSWSAPCWSPWAACSRAISWARST